MQPTEPRNSQRLSRKTQVAILSTILTGLVIATFFPDGFMNFLVGLRTGDPISLTLMVSIIGSGFVLLHSLGFVFDYKEQIELSDQI